MLLDEPTAESIRDWHIRQGGHGKSGPGPHALRSLNEFVEFCLASGCTPMQIADRVLAELTRQAHKGNYGGKYDPVAYAEEYGDVRVSLEVMRMYGGCDEKAICIATLMKLGGRTFEPDQYGVLWQPGKSMGY